MAKAKTLDIKEQKYIARLRKQGNTFRSICETTGFSLGAVTNAVDKFKVDAKEVKELQDKQKQSLEESARKEIAEFIPSDKVQAIKVHRVAMSMVDDKPAIALAAAEKTLDRIEGKPIQKNINENINVVATTEEILKMLHGEGIKV